MREDALIGKIYGHTKDGPLLSRRAPSWDNFSTCKDLDEGEGWKLVFVTDKGKIFGVSRFIGETNFNILGAYLIDYANQLIYGLKRNYPIVVSPSSEVTVR